MCEIPGCPNGSDEPIELTDENRAYMRVEATAAALNMLTMFCKGWTNGAEGILSDISGKWGFVAVTRCVYVLAQAVAILPEPKDSPLKKATPDSIREKLKKMAGEEFAEHVALQMITFGDQVQAAFKEVIAMARKGEGHEEEFTRRFDEITDAENIMQPLIQAVMLHSTVVFSAAMRDDNTPALDQFQSAVRAGLDLDEDGEVAKEVADLTTVFNLDDAQDR